MTTFIAGGKISARFALTAQAQSALTFGQPVKIVGDYLVDLCDASHIPIGTVTVPNVARGTGALAGTYPQAQTPGDVTFDVRGDSVQVVTAGAGGVSAGQPISVSSSGTYIAGAASDASHIGYALTTAAAGVAFDLLVL